MNQSKDTIKVLYIDRKTDFYLMGFINNIKQENFKVYLLDLMNNEFSDKFNEKVYKLLLLDRFFKIKGVRYILRYFAAIFFLIKFRNESWDIIHILGIKRENFCMLPFLRKQSKTIILTIYGRSTYLNITKRFLFRFVYSYIDIITFQNNNIKDEFFYFNNSVEKDKLIELQLPINHLKRGNFFPIQDKKSDAVQYFNLNKGKIRISCSSTISSYDQHYKIIDALSEIKYIKKVQLMFLLTYGGSSIKKKEITDYIKLKLEKFDVKIFENRMSDEEIIKYRLATDIYINMRISDQLAGAVVESLAAGSLLLSGSWLIYSVLDKIGVYYIKVENFNLLANVIMNSINDYSIYSKKSTNNIEFVLNEFCLENVIEKWALLYSKLQEGGL